MSARAFSPTFTIAFALLAACTGSGDPPKRNAPPASPSTSTGGVRLSPISRDATGAPRLLLAIGKDNAPPSGTAAEQARVHLVRHARALGTSRSDASALEVARVVRAGRFGTVTSFRSRVAGIEVVDHDTRLLTRRDGSLAVIAGRPPVVRTRPQFALSAADAFARALSAELGKSVSAVSVIDKGTLAGGYRVFAASGVPLIEPNRLKPVLAPGAGGALVSAYQIEIVRDVAGRVTGTEYRIDATSGAVLRKRSLNADASFQYRVYADPDDNRPLDGPLADTSPHPTGAPDLLIRDPIAPSLITMEAFNEPNDPWLPDGANLTRGNNVDAFADLRSPDGFSAGDVRNPATAPGIFDRIFNHNQGPLASNRQTRAVTTHLFYVNNWLHDWWYDSGFDEAAGNAQDDNFGRGGEDGDRLLANAQDNALEGTRDNANMFTPADGASPVMQMYVFSNQDARRMSVEPSGDLFGVALANFGPQSFDVTAQVRSANPSDGCASMGNVSGRIALINEGGACSSEFKVRRAQLDGAVGAIIAHNQAGVVPVDMQDTGTANPTIPSFKIRREDGQALRAQIGAGTVTATLTRGPGVEKDSSLDTGIIAHEWGHYMHHRLQNCGSYQCFAMSEGWGDFLGLHTMMREGDDADGVYGMGSYAAGDFVRIYGNGDGDANYFGIRRAPYTRDMTKNAMSFRHIAAGEPLPNHPLYILGNDNTEPHNAGEIWAEMLFESYQQLIDRSRDGDYSFDQARRRMTDYVVAGLALSPDDPTFVETRDSILAAAAVADVADAAAMAAGFAVRGAGSCAISPPADSFDFREVEEDFALSPRLGIADVVVDDSVTTCDADGDLDAEEVGLVRVTVVNPGAAPLTDGEVTLSNLSEGLTLPDGATKSVPSVPAYGSVEVGFPIALAASTEIVDGSLDVTATASSSCEETATAPFRARFNLIVTPNASSIDDVEADVSAWTLDDVSASIWSRLLEDTGNHLWNGIDAGSATDSQLVSPEVTVADTGPLVVRFSHRYSFEFSGGTYWDGGVIEITTDGGETWQDVRALGVRTGYDAVLTDISGNPLGGRRAYAFDSTGYPEMRTRTLDFADSLTAGQTVQIRFRIGTDVSVGGPGWDIDDIEFENVVAPPFPSVDPDTECEGVPVPDAGPVDGPDAGDGPDGGGGGSGDGEGDGDDDDDGGCGCRAGDGSPSATGLLFLLALVPLRRRRRRA